jgi:hypothetical protein
MNYAFITTVFIVASVRLIFHPRLPRPAFMDRWPWLARMLVYALSVATLYFMLRAASAVMGIQDLRPDQN